MDHESPDSSAVAEILFNVNITEAHRKRFWAKAEVRGPDDCWNWKASKSPKGYGNVKINYVQYRANRISYLIHYGPFLEALMVCHSCDNPACVNPKHLWLGDALKNAEDRDAKGRYVVGYLPVGEAHFCAKLTDAKVLLAREYYKKGGFSHRELGDLFGVAKETMSKLLQGKTWRHLL